MSPRTGDGLAFEVSGSGPAVLFLHEGIADRTMWDLQWERWGQRLTLIRYDHRGFGDSVDPEGEYSLHGDALTVLDAAGVERAALVGASMGGQAALDLALAAPDRVTALIAVVATPSGWEHPREHMARFEAVEAAYERDGIDAANELELRMWVDGERDPTEVDPAVRERVAVMNRAALAREDAREHGGNTVEPTELEPPALGRLGELAIPVLVITGAHDQPSVSAGARALAEGTGAELVEIAGAAHVPMIERPREFEAVALPFLERHAV